MPRRLWKRDMVLHMPRRQKYITPIITAAGSSFTEILIWVSHRRSIRRVGGLTSGQTDGGVSAQERTQTADSLSSHPERI